MQLTRSFWFSIVGVSACALLSLNTTGCGKKANQRLANTWPQVVGKDLPIPFPLTDAEITQLRDSLIEEGVDHAGKPLVAPAPAETEEDAQPAAETAPAEPAATPDPLAGADLEQIALARAIERGEYLANKRLACSECHGADYGGKMVADAMPVWTWQAPT